MQKSTHLQLESVGNILKFRNYLEIILIRHNRT